MNVRLNHIGEELVPELKNLQSKLLIAGGAGAAVCAIGLVMNPAQFVRSFLPAYMWLLSVTLGSLGLAMVHQVSGGAWGVVIRRILGAATRTLPLLTVLFIPIALGLHSLYPWADAAHVADDPILQWKQPYLNVPFFLARAAHLLRGLERHRVPPEQVVGRAGRDRRPGDPAQDADAQRRRAARATASPSRSRRSTG